jgi:hypothetical protein
MTGGWDKTCLINKISEGHSVFSEILFIKQVLSQPPVIEPTCQHNDLEFVGKDYKFSPNVEIRFGIEAIGVICELFWWPNKSDLILAFLLDKFLNNSGNSQN